ncbi:MAG: hypothetical protein QXV10_02890 [Nitrososphaerota archaeon]
MSLKEYKIYVIFGEEDLKLEVPPFFLNPEKRSFKSILIRKKEQEGTLFYILVSHKKQIEKLFLLKKIHPDIHIPEEFKNVSLEELTIEEEEKFIESIKKLEKEWKYKGNGIWFKRFGECIMYMVLILKRNGWSIRPVVSKIGIPGYGVEIPIDSKKKIDFEKEIKKEEIEEIHDHAFTLHYHLKVENLERYIALAKKWDYYLSEDAIWPAILDIKMF